MIENKDIYIVHYDLTPVIITVNKKEAERSLKIARAKNQYLPYKISNGLEAFYRNAEDFLNDYPGR